MSEEKNAVPEAENKEVETTTENKETVTPEITTKPSTEESKEPSKEPEVPAVDYKAELEQAQKDLDKKDSIIGHKEDVIKDLKKDKDEVEEETVEPEEVEEDKFVEFQRKQEEEMETFKFDQTKDKIDSEVDNLAKSEEEAELIKFHLKNSVKMAGYTAKEVKRAVKSAWLMANEKKILNTNAELAESLRSQASITTTANTSGQSIQDTSDEKLSGEEKKLVDVFAAKGQAITDSAPR